jgi:hypothetical protein
MLRQADIAVYDQDENLQLIVEVKKKSGASLDWVIQMHRNLLIHSVIPQSPYFLLALPDFFYLWRNSTSETVDKQPDYQIETAEALGVYVDQLPQPLIELSESSLALLVTSWLEDLVNSDLDKNAASPTLDWLFDSGLYRSIRGGAVAVEIVL